MIETIKNRRSIRRFDSSKVDEKDIQEILEAGIWAPSGLNNQPWRFVIVQDPVVMEKMAEQTKSGRIILDAPVCIAVFLDNETSYDRVKDIQSVGACLQNILLAIHHLGLGGVWLGEILKNRKQVESLLKVPENCELMAVVAFGHPAESKKQGTRKPLETFVMNRF
jgi:nitroreductase